MASEARQRRGQHEGEEEESRDNRDRSGSGETASSTKTKKPTDSAFKQQRLPAWQPILTAGTVLPTFFVIGIAFIPIGIGMLFFSGNVLEIKYDYTDCVSKVNGSSCADIIGDRSGEGVVCQCKSHNITLEEDWEGEVYMYYGLTNFYQNHRRYVKSRDDKQLLGENLDDPGEDCAPFDKDPEGKPYVPCGAIANSLFSDEINLIYLAESGQEEPLELTNTGIAWESDKKYKFKNPEGDLETAFKDTARPRDWHKDLWELDPDNPDNNGLQNEDLIVWMRTAALPNFRKLYRKIKHPSFDGLPQGEYKLDITYRFRVKQFSGTKSVILSTTSLLGGKNPFLAIAYITVGSICCLMGVLFLFIHIKFGKQTNEMMNITSRSAYN